MSDYCYNSVFFGEDIAGLYDRTRPFIEPTQESLVLSELCQQLSNQFADQEIIDLLEVGAGTGRIAVAIAHHYSRLAVSASQSETSYPHLRINCIDTSDYMLKRLREKLESFRSEHVSFSEPSVIDVRDSVLDSQCYHAVIAHWVFHVMSDWRVAVYAIDNLLREDGLLFLFREQSPLYRAIDGDLRDLENEPDVLMLWNMFHEQRERIARNMSKDWPVLPARARLGSMVVDGRVQQMFAALGWDQCREFSVTDNWTCKFTIEELIEIIIRQRAFTNMHLFPNERRATAEFGKIADQLRDRFSTGFKKGLHHIWTFRTEFSARAVTYSGHRYLSRTSCRVILDVARETLGRRWRRRLDHSYDRASLWQRLVSVTWNRINTSGAEHGPLQGLECSWNNGILGILASLPPEIRNDKQYVCANDPEALIWRHPENLWGEIAAWSETHDPFCLAFENRLSESDKELLKSERLLLEYRRKFLHPYVHVLVISAQLEAELQKIPDPEKNIPWDSQPSKAYTYSRCILAKEPILSFIEQAKACGILPFSEIDKHANFLVGLARMVQHRKLITIYVFPYRAQLRGEDEPSIGLAVGSEKLIDAGAIDFLWSLGDIVFNEYIEDVYYCRELTSNMAVTRQHVASVVAKPGTPARALCSESNSSPDILIVVAADVELEAVLNLAGITDDLTDWRIPGHGDVFIDLGFGGISVWVVLCEAGSSGPGGSTATVLAALQSLEPKPFAVIMPGICFGLKKGDQRIGDILIAKQIHPYNVQKRNPCKIISRGEKPMCSEFLLRYLRGCAQDWNPETEGDVKPKIHKPGIMMSGETLSNDPDFVKSLLDLEEEAIGGEMEAMGVYSASYRQLTHWIVVKAICDWGMGKGDKYQRIAATNAVDFVFHALRQEAFAETIKK